MMAIDCAGKGAAQQRDDARCHWVFKAMERWVFPQDALPELLRPGAHICVDIDDVLVHRASRGNCRI
jgi:hypothetical protein